jgi:hypothetical protein
MTAVETTPTTVSSRPLAERIGEHSGLALTALYLVLIGIGMMYEWWLFRRFGVNVLYYAEAADFLLVPFREPLVMLVSLAPIPLFLLYSRVFTWLGRRIWRRPKKEVAPETAARLRRTTRGLNALAMLLWSIAATAEFAEWVSRRIRDGHRASVRIELAADNGISPKLITGPLIGSTNQFLFVFDRQTNQTRIVTLENVVEVVVDAKKKKTKKK